MLGFSYELKDWDNKEGFRKLIDKFDHRLVDQIVALKDEEFCRLAAIRLNLPLSKNQMNERVITEEEREYWTEECLIDEAFLQLAGTKAIVKNGGKRISIYKYYNQAFRLRNWITIAKPTPEFIINISDLTPRIYAEIKALKKEGYEYVLKQAVGRIFENIDPRQCHLSIARKLKVRIDA